MKKSYDFSGARRGAVVEPKGKTRITIWIDDAVLDAFRARAADRGVGYQTMINDALRACLADDGNSSFEAITPTVLRRIIREELHAVPAG
jgi:hypothetical protein